MSKIVDACRDSRTGKWNVRIVKEDGTFQPLFISDEEYRITRLREKLIDSGASLEDLEAFELFIIQRTLSSNKIQ